MTSKREKLQYAYVFLTDFVTTGISVVLAWLITDNVFNKLQDYATFDWIQALCLLLLAFVLGLPANEIVLPSALMAYLSQSSLQGLGDPAALKTVLLANGWCTRKAACTVIFTLFHWPCSTTLLTVYKETNSRRWTALAAILPTALGAILCALVAAMWG